MVDELSVLHVVFKIGESGEMESEMAKFIL